MSSKKTNTVKKLVTRRQMIGFCLAGGAGTALWGASRYSALLPGVLTDAEAHTVTVSEADSDGLTEHIKNELTRQGADLVGMGNLSELPENSRRKMPFGICVAVKFPTDIVNGIIDLPTRGYYDWYNTVNSRLHSLAASAVGMIERMGYKATLGTSLPHKTIATRAGVGWVGKSNLLVTESYGSMIRLASILTDAPLTAATPINQSKCGDCRICTDACPAGALSGKLWDTTVHRDEILSTSKCSAMAIKRSIRGFGVPIELCGKCFAVCKYTQRYISGEGKQV